MPVLNWIGKEAVVKHHKEVPFRLLEPVAELSCGLSTTPSSEHTEKNTPPYEGGVADAAFQAADGVGSPGRGGNGRCGCECREPPRRRNAATPPS